LCKQRFADGQEYNERLRNYGDERDQDIALRRGFLEKGYNGRYYLTELGARDLWDRIDDLEDHGDNDAAATLYCERFQQLEGHEMVTEQVWEELQHVESPESKALIGLILPALSEACTAQIATPAYVELAEAYKVKVAARHAREEAERAVRIAASQPVAP
jgi:hypothetical protein